MPSPSSVVTAIVDAMLDVLQRHLTNFSTNRVKPPHEMCTYSNRPDPEGSSLTSLCNDFLRIGHPQADLYLPAPPLHPQISKFSYVGQAHRSRSVAIDPSRPYVSSSWTAGQYWRWHRAGAWQCKLYPQGTPVDHPFKRYKLIRACLPAAALRTSQSTVCVQAMMWACAQTKNGRLKRPDCARAAAARCCPCCVASRHPCPPPPAPPCPPRAGSLLAAAGRHHHRGLAGPTDHAALPIARYSASCASSPRHVQRALPRVRACLVACIKTRHTSPATEPVPVPCRLPLCAAFSTVH